MPKDHSIPPGTVTVHDYERVFHERFQPMVRAYIAGYAGDGLTARANRAAFDQIKVTSRVLRKLTGANTGLDVLGTRLASPIMIAPMAWHGLVHDGAELESAHGAALAGNLFCLSTQASRSLEEVAQCANGPKWFQLYTQPQFADTMDLVRRAERAGYQALVICVDAPITGIRNIEQRAGFYLPDHVRSVNVAGYQPPQSVPTDYGSPVFQGLLDHAADWDMVAKIKAETRLPVILKGIMNAQDAVIAKDLGLDGIVVSNHGGRCLDGLPASIEVLPEIIAATGPDWPVLLDGGIRRGLDVAKALSLGARAVFVGQPILHALGVGGHVGVAHLLTILQTELEASMALMGVQDLTEFGPHCLWQKG